MKELTEVQKDDIRFLRRISKEGYVITKSDTYRLNCLASEIALTRLNCLASEIALTQYEP